ncbi:SDR family NAD(P)-dependent oxidoreductase, partial [Nocardioides sp.]|uniref:SDR family NAD(P)-dependent oxidoreductase n=1 Tax=Nocardioides sp. TaxID=35761 RepID=UPI002D80C40A
MTNLLEDKVVVLSGVGPGLGRALGEEAARMGADLVLVSRTERRLEKMAEVVRSHGRRALVVPTDVTDEDAVVNMVQTTVGEFGRVDVMLNNASQPGTDLHVWEQTLENWNRCIAAVVTGPMLCTREVLKQSMLDQRSGSIVNFSSTASINGHPRKSHYAVAKSGLRLLTK